MPIDLVIDEREGEKGDCGDTNNNSGNSSMADTSSHTDGGTPDRVSNLCFYIHTTPLSTPKLYSILIL